MSIFNGLLVLLICQCAGEAIKGYFNLSLPGPVLGMMILFSGLMLLKRIPESIEHSSRILIAQLGLMFLPAAAGLFFLGSKFNDQWPAIIGAVVLGSVLSLIFNGLIMRWLVNRQTRTNNRA